MNKWIITATPPTTNGDLHVGHLSGPYLGGDVFARSRRMLGDVVLYVTGGDDSQTYVVTSAERLGTSPEALAAKSNAEIQETLALADVSIDAYTSPNPEYAREIQSFFAGLYDAGKLRRRSQELTYSERDGRFLFEAYIQGNCPECYATTCGAICENCGHPNDAESLLDPRRTGGGDGSGLVSKRVETLTLPLEDHRAELEAFYAALPPGTRPHLLRFVGQMLERPLPEFPISYPSTWGIPVTIDGFSGQTFNAWAEMFPALAYMARTAARGQDREDRDSVWSLDGGYQLVQFLGFDNSFYFSFAHLCLALAHGRTVRPRAIVTNEFYHLDNEKFSTSRRHLIPARELVTKYGPDSARFYLARNGPETQVANFVESEFRDVVRRELHQPLRRALTRTNASAGREVTVSEADHGRYARFARRMQRAYALETFSLREASDAIAGLVSYVANRGEQGGATASALGVERLGMAYVCAHAWPLMPSLSQALWSRMGLAGAPSPTTLAELPALPAHPEIVMDDIIRQW